MIDFLDIPREEAAKALKELGFSDPKRALKNISILSEGPFRGIINRIIEESSLSPSPDDALNNLEAVSRGLRKEGILKFIEDHENIKKITYLCGSSPFLSGILAKDPLIFDWLFLDGGLYSKKDYFIFSEELWALTLGIDQAEDLSRALRVYKSKEILRIGARDLLRVADVIETTAELSDLAGASLDKAVEFAVKDQKKLYGTPLYRDEKGTVKEAEFTVIGLGKLGGRELNFSSDIDILYIYSSDDGETTGVDGRPGSSITLHAFFVKVSMLVTKLISSVTSEGFVFRVDLDLRPEGPSGVMANSLESAEAYYESWGQTWERAAMIKARAVAGSRPLGEEFLDVIRPFIYRRYLDFTALEEIKTMKEKINLSLLRKRADAVDVKLGAGGVREIEFICQALELIHAGKVQDLRERNTLKAIDKLKDHGLLKEKDAEALREGYVFLRDLEHRIQIVDGRQTQAIPARAAELERVARMMGFGPEGGAPASSLFFERYREITESVHEVFRSLFYKAGEESPLEKGVPDEVRLLLSAELTAEEGATRLKALGFRDPGEALKNIELLRGGPRFAHLGARARVLLQKLAPAFLLRASRSPDPDRSLAHIERFLSAVGPRTTFYSLLYENPPVVDELVTLFGSSVFLSRALIEQPGNIDILLSKDLYTPYKPRGEFFKEFGDASSAEADFEEKLDSLRRLRNQEILRIGVNDTGGHLTPRQVSAQITFLAEASIEAAYTVSFKDLEGRYGSPGASFAVIGLGKLGGRELIYGSDLDIIFIYSDTGEGRTDGAKPISSHEFFVKLCQRMISVLSLRTKEGVVFNVDTRLRPSGSSGPLVVSRESFLNYHRGKTQVWERQAMIKARAVAGDRVFAKEVLEELKGIVYGRGLLPEEVSEMLRIRRRMEVEIAKEDATRYNIKTGSGGLVDIEFLTQALQLRYGREKEPLRTQDTLKALKRLSREGIVPEGDYRFLRDAYAFLRLLEMRLRIVHDRPEGYLVKGTDELASLGKKIGYEGDPGESLLADYTSKARKVRELYLKTLEELSS